MDDFCSKVTFKPNKTRKQHLKHNKKIKRINDCGKKNTFSSYDLKTTMGDKSCKKTVAAMEFKKKRISHYIAYNHKIFIQIHAMYFNCNGDVPMSNLLEMLFCLSLTLMIPESVLWRSVVSNGFKKTHNRNTLVPSFFYSINPKKKKKPIEKIKKKWHRNTSQSYHFKLIMAAHYALHENVVI